MGGVGGEKQEGKRRREEVEKGAGERDGGGGGHGGRGVGREGRQPSVIVSFEKKG